MGVSGLGQNGGLTVETCEGVVQVLYTSLTATRENGAPSGMCSKVELVFCVFLP